MTELRYKGVKNGFVMQRARYVRVLILFVGGFACVGVNLWLMTTGHFRLPLFVLVGYVLAVVLIFRKLPPPTMTQHEVQRNLLKVSHRLRRLGLMGAVGFALFVLSFSRDEFKGIPNWGIVILFLWGAFVVWCYLWGTRWYKRKAEETSVSTDKGQGRSLPPR